MERRAIVSNVTSGEMAAILAAMRANVPPTPEIRPAPPGGTLCAHATDTGELAFPGLPCRGAPDRVPQDGGRDLRGELPPG